MTSAAVVSNLSKTYPDGTTALRDVSFEIQSGTVFSLLGRNGSGKTTTVRILTGLLEPTSGKAHVLGYDVTTQRAEVQARIGVTLQEAAIDAVLTGREFLEFVASVVGLGRGQARRRAAELLELFDLATAADRAVGTYSGGMQRRVDLAAALIRRPDVLFLDEPTTGLDPQNRRTLWAEIEQLRADGTTVLLTTQYLEEAEALADVIAVLHGGRVVAVSDPDTLRSDHGRTRLRLQLDGRGLDALHEMSGNGLDRDASGRVTVGVDDPDAALSLLRRLRRRGVSVGDFEIRRDSLEDVFLGLTGDGDDAGAGVLVDAG